MTQRKLTKDQRSKLAGFPLKKVEPETRQTTTTSHYPKNNKIIWQ